MDMTTALLEALRKLTTRVNRLETLETTYAGTAGDADTVDGIHAATTATANKLLALDADKDLELGTGDANATDATMTGGINVGTASGAAAGQVIGSGDLFAVSDEAGVMLRNNRWATIAPTDHFDADALGGSWAWQGGAFVTPASVNHTVFDSVLYAGFGTGQGTSRAILYRTTITDYQQATMTLGAPVAGNFIGLLYADDAIDNAVGLVVKRATSGTAMTYSLTKVQRTGGGAWAETDVVTGLTPGQWINLGISIAGTKYTNWNLFGAWSFGTPNKINGTLAEYLAGMFIGLTWTPTRQGILMYTAQVTNADTYRGFETDWYWAV